MNNPFPKIQDNWLQCKQSTALMELFATNGYTLRFVGGVVRNALLGEPINDFDMATDARPETILELAQSAGFKAIGTGIDHGTVTVIVDNTVYEITTLRVDMETDGRHAFVAFTDSWVEDAARRDFTINALYVGADGVVFDPLDGYQDLIERRVRFIGDPHERITEDYLRILRFFRFSAQYGEGDVDREGLAACVALRQGLKTLSRERVGSELMRLLLMPRASDVLETMFVHGLLLPLTSRVPHLSRFQKWLIFESDLGRSASAINRLGALFMLVGGDAKCLAKKLRLSNKEKARLKLWAAGDRAHQFGLREQISEKQAHILSYHLQGDYQLSVAINWLLSGAVSTDPKWRRLYDLPKRWQPPKFPLKGQDLLKTGMSPGPSVGKKLLKLEQAWIETDFDLSADELLKRV